MRRSARLPTRRFFGLGFCAALALAPAAGAQAPLPMAHGLTPGPPPLHARVATADVAAIATLEAVVGGRLRFASAAPLLGAPPERFEVKRQPSATPRVEAGDRLLLLLRGARSPYLLLETPGEPVRIADELDAARWSAAIRGLAEARGDPALLRPLYLEWSESDADALRDEALRALLQPGGPLLPLPPALAMERARVALDATRAPAVRRAAATLAATDAAALDLLLSRIGAAAAAVDPALAAEALRAGLARGRPTAARALATALRGPDPELRLAALELVPQAPRETVEPDLAALAARDPDPRVREQAAHWLARVQRIGAGEP